MKLILVRHGETEGNVKRVMSDNKTKLTEKGREQAKKLALRLKNEKIDVIFSSDLDRAVETTNEVLKFHKIPVFYSSEIRERNHGRFECKPYEVFKKAQDESSKSKIDFDGGDSESYSMLAVRAKSFLEKLMQEYEGKTVLISSHGGFNRMALGILLKKPLDEASELQQHNACINIVEVDENSNHTAHIINSIEHL